MDILIVMCLGMLLGRLKGIRKFKKQNGYVSLTCTFVLIFSMGVMLGGKENFFGEISSLGMKSFLFFLLPTVLSIVLVYILTQKFMGGNRAPADEKEDVR